MARVVNLEIDQGATFSQNVSVSTVVMDDHTGAAQLRKHPGSNTSVAFTVTIANTSTVTVGLDAATLANTESGKYLYDVTVTNVTTSEVTRVVEGTAFINAAVTR